MKISDVLMELVAAIKAKKDVHAVEDRWICEKIMFAIGKQKTVQQKIEKSTSYTQFSRSREYEFLLKSIRAELHAVYGTFQQQLKQRRKYFDELKRLYGKNAPREQILALHQNILKTHTSTKERLQNYPQLYKKLFARTGIPKTVLDISCGLNPFSYPWMGCAPTYIATEITKEDCVLINEYFGLIGIDGKVMQLDLVSEREKLSHVAADVCFLWKVLDTMEYLERNISQKILPIIHMPWIIVSFSTKTLSGKPMKKKQRLWFEKICTENKWDFDIEEFENELFYVVRKG